MIAEPIEIAPSPKGRLPRPPLRADATCGPTTVWERDVSAWEERGTRPGLTIREAGSMDLQPGLVVVWYPRGAPVQLAGSAYDVASFRD